MQIVTILPCYNVEPYCQQVIEKTLRYATSMILIDDGSTDRTGMILRQLQQNHQSQIHLITFQENRGKGEALRAGMKYAMTSPFDVLVTLDSDGQHLPREIPQLVERIKWGVDLVIGCRQFDRMPFCNRFANTVISFLLCRIYRNAPRDTQSGFRAFTPQLVRKIIDQVSGSRYEMEFQCLLLALHGKARVECCPIETIYLDKNRSSHFSNVKDSLRILSVLFQHWKSKTL